MAQSDLKLPDKEFIAGSTETLEFTIYDKNDELLDLRNSLVSWYLSNIGDNDNPLVVKTGTTDIAIPSIGKISITLNPNDTVDLTTGKYEHELSITQPNGKVLKPCYGYLKIKDCAKTKI